jgi:glucose-1-phosphate adenylyltransferase
MMMGADYYETDAEMAAMLAVGKVPLGIGENTTIRFANFSVLFARIAIY